MVYVTSVLDDFVVASWHSLLKEQSSEKNKNHELLIDAIKELNVSPIVHQDILINVGLSPWMESLYINFCSDNAKVRNIDQTKDIDQDISWLQQSANWSFSGWFRS